MGRMIWPRSEFTSRADFDDLKWHRTRPLGSVVPVCEFLAVTGCDIGRSAARPESGSKLNLQATGAAENFGVH